MKYLIAIFSIVLFSFQGLNAQKILRPLPLLDTVSNTGNSEHVISVSGSFNNGVFQYVGTKISGTVAGKTYLMGSVDNTNFVKLDSITNTNVTTNTKIFTQTRPMYPYYKIRSEGSGTMSLQTKAYAHFKI
jgi:hypothetical protein